MLHFVKYLFIVYLDSFCFCNVLHLLIYVCWPTLESLERSQCHVAHNPFIVMLNVNFYFVEEFYVYAHWSYWSGIFFFVFQSNFSNRVLLALENDLKNGCPFSSGHNMRRIGGSS